jgi:hypothetical protein
MTWAQHLYSFYSLLQPPKDLPNGIEWLYPQQKTDVLEIVKRFLNKFYNDDQPRVILMGINPGRFGAGVTGINFTAPKQLENDCGLNHSFQKQSELSAEFIYKMINTYGGPEIFYKRFFIGSVSPLGFIKKGKNINYYDDASLLVKVEPFIVQNMENLLSFNANREVCICIGEEKNYKYLAALNKKYNWFENISSVPHPRFIMQYRRKRMEEYIQQYINMLQ